MSQQPSTLWPSHWYRDEHRIHCIVPDCSFVTSSWHARQQWKEMNDHCSTTIGAEHALFHIMLNQTMCAINNCTHLPFSHGGESFGHRALFKHERDAHGSAEMSSICSFVRLAREGRIRKGQGNEPNCERLTYYRMMEKIWALPSAGDIIMLFQRNGYHDTDEQTSENLRKILTHDPLANDGDDPPFWWPVKAESFLSQCCPDFSNPADREWARVWTDLRERYADGRI